MGEADWWLCSRCSSLNNLAARKCYSCQQHRPKDSLLASEYLGYIPRVSWDGKVTMEQIERRLPRAEEPEEVPPIRDPVRRSTLAVAGRPPYPASITYRLVDRPLPQVPPPGAPMAPAASRVMGRPMSAPPPPVPPLVPVIGADPAASGPAGPGWAPAAPSRPGPHRVPVEPGPRVPVGPGPPPVAEQTRTWPHWRELLDGPRPEVTRLRAKLAADAGTAGGVPGTAGDRSLREAMQQARSGGSSSSGSFTPWPPADRPLDESEQGSTEPRAAGPIDESR